MVVLALVALVLVGLPFFRTLLRRKPGRHRNIHRFARRHPNKPGPNTAPDTAPDMADPKNQMDAIAHIGFETCRLLNREEARVLPVLERAARRAKLGHRVMAQTSLGEVLRPVSGRAPSEAAKRAFAAINSKRLDFALFNRFGILVCAVEYQGSGHYRPATFMRDAVKREALRKAGVPLLEVRPDFTAPELEQQVLQVISPTTDKPPNRP